MPKRINNEWVFTEAELDEMNRKAELAYEEYIKDKPVATRYVFDPKERLISIRATDGSRIDFPVWKIKELQTASNSEIKKGYITKAGDAIHWDNLDAHYTVAGLAANIFGTKEWMRELGRQGGQKTSIAKATAARTNGQRGGRPRKITNTQEEITFTAGSVLQALRQLKHPLNRTVTDNQHVFSPFTKQIPHGVPVGGNLSISQTAECSI